MSSNFSLYVDTPNKGDDYLLPMFSTPLLHLRVRNWNAKKKKLLEIYQSRKSENGVYKINNEKDNPFDVETDYHHNYDTGENYNEQITNIFRNELEILSDTFECSLEVCTTWFETAGKGKQHATHNHGTQGFSAVCFVNFDPEYHTPTVFLNPNLCDDINLTFMPMEIDEGSLIFFPSYILHYTEPNSSNVDRLILSFNIDSHYDHDPYRQ